MGLCENMSNEKVRELDLREPVVVGQDVTIHQAIERMREKRLGCVIVVDNQRKPTGMFTESMLTRLLVQNSSIVNEPLVDHLADRWPWVRLDDPIVDVLEAMRAMNVRFICVVDNDGRLAAPCATLPCSLRNLPTLAAQGTVRQRTEKDGAVLNEKRLRNDDF